MTQTPSGSRLALADGRRRAATLRTPVSLACLALARAGRDALPQVITARRPGGSYQPRILSASGGGRHCDLAGGQPYGNPPARLGYEVLR